MRVESWSRTTHKVRCSWPGSNGSGSADFDADELVHVDHDRLDDLDASLRHERPADPLADAVLALTIADLSPGHASPEALFRALVFALGSQGEPVVLLAGSPSGPRVLAVSPGGWDRTDCLYWARNTAQSILDRPGIVQDAPGRDTEPETSQDATSAADAVATPQCSPDVKAAEMGDADAKVNPIVAAHLQGAIAIVGSSLAEVHRRWPELERLLTGAPPTPEPAAATGRWDDRIAQIRGRMEALVAHDAKLADLLRESIAHDASLMGRTAPSLPSVGRLRRYLLTDVEVEAMLDEDEGNSARTRASLGLPLDAAFIGHCRDWATRLYDCVVESKEWPEVPRGAEVQVYPVGAR